MTVHHVKAATSLILLALLPAQPVQAQNPKCSTVLDCAEQMVRLANDLMAKNTELSNVVAELKEENRILRQDMSNNKDAIGVNSNAIGRIGLRYECWPAGLPSRERVGGQICSSGDAGDGGSTQHTIHGIKIWITRN